MAAPAWHPADFEACLVGLTRAIESTSFELLCRPYLDVVTGRATIDQRGFTPERYLSWVSGFAGLIGEITEQIAMAVYMHDRAAGERFYGALLVLIEAELREGGEAAADVATGAISLDVALRRFTEPDPEDPSPGPRRARSKT